MLTKWRCWSWDPARVACVIAHEALQNALFRSLWWLELFYLDESRHEGRHRCCRRNGVVGFGIAKDCNENQHKGGHGRRRRNDNVKFGIACVQRAFGKDCDENHMKEDMGVVNEMTSSTMK